MKIDKDPIVNLLREQGHHQKADRADRELPGQVDHEEHAGLLGQLGVDPKELLGKVNGGGGLGKLFGKG